MTTQKVNCQICGKRYNAVTNSHTKSHGISLTEYKFLFGTSNSSVNHCSYQGNTFTLHQCGLKSLAKSENHQLCILHDPDQEKDSESFTSTLQLLMRMSIGQKSDLHLEGTVFPSDFDVENSVFEEKAYFSDCHFFGSANFSKTIFKKRAYFKGCRFQKDADFFSAIFCENVSFREAEFSQKVSFVGAEFSSDAYFWNTKFNGTTLFSNVTFKDMFVRA